MDLSSHWPSSLAEHTGLRDRLLAAYDDPGRGYHDRQHLAEVLEHLTVLGARDDAVLLAAWFHDAVYDGDRDDEERSAALAETELTQAGLPEDLVAEVVRLVRLTTDHRPDPEDRDGELLCDADLAILAAPAERYASYVAGVRREYAVVPDDEFAQGRTAVLEDLLAKPTLFHSADARERWEETARANVEAELSSLAASGPAAQRRSAG